MYFWLTLPIGVLLLVFEMKALRAMYQMTFSISLAKCTLLWLALFGLGGAFVRYIGFLEYPLSFYGDEHVTGVGFPILALATVHKEHSVLDLGSLITVPTLFVDAIILFLVPVWLSSFWLKQFSSRHEPIANRDG
jgi:hypothetical protein